MPIHIKHIQTNDNGLVELRFSNGKKVLNTLHTNYSYGTSQAILRFGLKKIEKKNITSVLVLGLGGGSVIKTLRSEFNLQHKIDAVEIDACIISIAIDEFNVREDENLVIIEDDAFHYVTTTSNTYSTIVIDLFIDDVVPEFVYSSEFLNKIHAILDSHGSIVFNAAVSDANNLQTIQLLQDLKQLFDVSMYNYVESTNTVIVAKKHA